MILALTGIPEPPAILASPVMFELPVVIAVLLIALLPLASLLRSPVLRRVGVAGVGLAVLGAIAIGWAEMDSFGPRREALDRRVTNRPVQVHEHGYVGAESCRACHPHEHETWHHSYHRTMTQIAGDHSIIPEFDGRELVDFGRTHRISKDDEGYWVEIDERKHVASETPREPPENRTRHRVVMTTGSHHMQAFWFSTGNGREIELFDFAYKRDEQQWMPVHALFINPPGAGQSTRGRWNTSCNKCHATHPEPRIHEDPPDTIVAEFGISCEACHGPGEDHVQHHRNPANRYRQHFVDDADPTVVDPMTLDPARQSEVCGQCHSVNKALDMAGHHRWEEHGFDFRPGDALQDEREVQREGERWFWSDGMVRVSGREYNGLSVSPCFTHGDPDRGVLSCISCHDMHPEDERSWEEWSDDQLGVGMRGNAACTQCHEEYEEDDALAAHSHHSPGGGGSLRYDCHMPHTTYGLLKTMRSHTVDSPSVTAELETTRPNACNLCHLDQTIEWTANKLHDWYGQPSPEDLRGGQGLSDDEKQYSPAVRGILAGDAGMRAIYAWHFGWGPAQEVSGTEWMAPYLAQLLSDSYPAVRFSGLRSLRTLPGFREFEFDLRSLKRQSMSSVQAALRRWQRRGDSRAGDHGASVLLLPDRQLDHQTFLRLQSGRDDRPVTLSE